MECEYCGKEIKKSYYLADCFMYGMVNQICEECFEAIGNDERFTKVD